VAGSRGPRSASHLGVSQAAGHRLPGNPASNATSALEVGASCGEVGASCHQSMYVHLSVQPSLFSHLYVHL
jgi:hypothetical protein